MNWTGDEYLDYYKQELEIGRYPGEPYEKLRHLAEGIAEIMRRQERIEEYLQKVIEDAS